MVYYNSLMIDKERGKGKYIKVGVSVIRLKTNWRTCSLYTSHIHWVVWGTGTPKDRDEVNRREVWECDG